MTGDSIITVESEQMRRGLGVALGSTLKFVVSALSTHDRHHDDGGTMNYFRNKFTGGKKF